MPKTKYETCSELLTKYVIARNKVGMCVDIKSVEASVHQREAQLLLKEVLKNLKHVRDHNMITLLSNHRNCSRWCVCIKKEIKRLNSLERKLNKEIERKADDFCIRYREP